MPKDPLSTADLSQRIIPAFYNQNIDFLTLTALEYFSINHGDQRVYFSLKSP